MKILVVDDHPDNRAVLVTLLGYQGHRLLEAGDGAAALATVRAERPDLVITDVLMPTMDGYEFVRRLRADPAVAATPVIFCTAHYHEREAQALARSCGVVHVLAKPAEPEVVLGVVAQVLGLAAPPPPPQDFDQEHRRLLTDKLSQTVAEVRASNHRLAALIDIGLQLASERDRDRLLDGFCQAARDLLGARCAAVGVVDESGNRLRAFFTSGLDADALTGLTLPAPREGILGALLAGRRSRRLRGLGGATRAPLFPPHLEVRSFLGAPILSPERAYGWACLGDKVGADEFSTEDERSLAILAALVGRVYENGTMYSEARRRTAELEREVAERQRAEEALRWSDARLRVLARRLMEAQETERRHLAHELHDEVGQNLTVLKINLHNARRLAGTDAAGAVLQDSIALVEQTLQQLRNLSLDLRPPLLDAAGLPAALRWYLDRQAERTGLAIRFTADPPDAHLPAAPGIVCFRVVQEALTNVLRHARARRVDVELWQADAAVQLLIRDDGLGFDVEAARARARGGSLGLLGMQERVSLVGGELDVSSTPGQGTQVRVRIPLQAGAK